MSTKNLLGQMVGHFRLLEKLGSGGMGVVYRAHDERLDRDVAIKILPAGSFADEATRMRFKQEAMALAKLNHPNIAAVYNFDSDQDTNFLVMELLAGKTLADKLEAGLLPPDMVVDFGIQMCEGLASAHQQGILHRDLKPANIGFTADGRLKILDFGLAKLLPSNAGDVTSSVTEVAPIVGTLRYMAPEQLRGKSTDVRADIYTAGIVLYEMATGKHAYQEEGASLIDAILNRLPIPPSRLNPVISPALTAVIVKATEKDPARRYSSAQDLLADLKRVAAGEKTTVVRQALHSRIRGLLLAAVGLAFVLGTAVFFWHRFHRGPIDLAKGQKPMILVGDFENRTGESVFDSSLHEMFTASLEQSPLVQVFPRIRLADVLRRMNQTGKPAIDERTGLEICQRENLQGLLLGSIVRLGKKYVILARIEAPSGADIATVQQSADGADQIPAGIDDITETLRRKLGESSQSFKENSVPLAKVTSSSIEAVRYFTLGKESFFRDDDNQAVLMFRKALELDPDFAMAHEYLALIYLSSRDYERSYEQIHQAASLADQVSEPERLRIMGLYYGTRLDFTRQCQSYQLLMQLEPEDPVPYINLGYCEGERLNFAAAVNYTEKGLQFVPQSTVRINLASQLLDSGNPARALQIAESFIHDFAHGHAAQAVLGHAYLAFNRFDDARQAFKDMLPPAGSSEIEGRRYLADLDMALGQYPEAEAELKAAISLADKNKNHVAAAKARAALAELLLGENLPSRAEQLLAHADLPLTHPTLDFLIGRAHAWMGHLQQANQSLRALDLLIEKDDVPALQALRYLLSAEIALRQHKDDEAVKNAEKAAQYQNSVFTIETLARSYAAAGLYTQAAQQYEILLARANELTDDDTMQPFDAPAFRRAVQAHYQLGVLYQKLGKLDQARAHLQKFLDDWRQADETLGIYKDAQRLLRSLPSTGTPTPAT